MRRNRLLLVCLSILLVGLGSIFLTPFFVSGGLHLWVWWQARRQGLRIELEKIDAPFLQPVTIQRLRITSAHGAAFRTELSADYVSVDLNLASILAGSRGRAIRTLSMEKVRAEMHRNFSGEVAKSQLDWLALQKLLPANFNFGGLDLRIESGTTVVLLRNAALSGSEIEAGRFNAGEITIASPWFRQTYSRLRGATRWQDNRLTLGGISLTRGLDLESMTTDLSRLGKQRADLQFDLDAFGGKIRASFSNEWRPGHSNWNVAGAATDISLAQTSQAIGFTDRLGGALHACNFTFRGDLRDATHATASIWTELTELSWHDRTAEVIMLGAALYNRQIQLQQFYIKQRNNQLTLSGEGSLASKSPDWLSPDFRGDISGSISDLGAFAALFGAEPGDFAGEIAIDGMMNARDRKIAGHLIASGNSLSIFKTQIDNLTAKLNLKANEIEVEQLELDHNHDFVRAQGKIDIAHEHNYSATAQVSVGNAADYISAFPGFWLGSPRQGSFNFDWTGLGNSHSHSGKFLATGRALVVDPKFLPFDVDLEASYSPGNLFFRQFHLANEHAALNAFVTLAPNYLQLQTLTFELNGKPMLRGNIFLPLAIAKTRAGENLLDSLDTTQDVDVELVIDPMDVAELSSLLQGRPTIGGGFAARLSLFGPLDSLQGSAEGHLRNFFFAGDPARLFADAEIQFSSGTMHLKTAATASGSDPVRFDGSLAVRLGKQRDLISDQPISATLDFPAIFLARLPHFLSHDLFREGILSGRLSMSETLRHPRMAGDLQLIEGKLGPRDLPMTEASGKLSFHGTNASIDFADVRTEDVDLSLQGGADFQNTDAVEINISGVGPVLDLTPREVAGCVGGIQLLPAPPSEISLPAIDEINLRGNALTGDWTIALSESRNGQSFGATDGANVIRIFRLCSSDQAEQEVLALGCEPRRMPGIQRRKRARHR